MSQGEKLGGGAAERWGSEAGRELVLLELAQFLGEGTSPFG